MDYIINVVCGKTTKSVNHAILRLVTTSSLMSFFISNTVVATVFFSPVAKWARRHGIYPSQVILPVCYAIAIGACCTIIGTGNNLLISDMYHELTGRHIGFFEPFKAGFPLMLLCLVFLILVARLLPKNSPDTSNADDDSDLDLAPAANSTSAAVGPADDRRRGNKKFIALGLLAAIILGSCLGLFSLVTGCGVVIIILAAMRCLGNKEAWRYVPWSQLILFAGSTAMANSLARSSLDDTAASLILDMCGGSNIVLPLILIVGISLVLKVIISSYAIVAILVPVSVTTAEQLGCSPMPFLMAIMFSCAYAFTTPYIGAMESLAMSYGNYSLKDMAKFGIPFTLLIYAASIVLCLMFYSGVY